jgi:uncharacterized protein HemX
MSRQPPLTQLARLLVVLGIVVAVSAFGYQFVVKNAMQSQQQISGDLEARLDFLENALATAITPDDSVAIAREVDMTKESLARAHRRLSRRQQEYRGIWRFNGRGPMLIVVGLLFFGIGVRLHRFVQYGE